MLFAQLGPRQIVADFDGGSLTSDAGVLLLREIDLKTGLTQAVAAAIPDPRNPDLIEHEQAAMIRQRILSLAQGYEDLNDQQHLRNDPVLQVAAGCQPDPDRPLASPPTLCRLENRVGRQACVDISKVLVEQFIQSHTQAPEQLILDLDATDTPVHGRQEGRFFHGYYDHYCFLPLYVFCGDELLVAYLRPSNIDAAMHSRAIVKLLVARLRQAWPGVRIIIRGDSGFCRWRLMRWCDRNNVSYILGLARNNNLERLAQPLTVPAAWHFERTREKQRLFESFAYAAGTWDRERRVIVKAEHGAQGPNPRFIVTNLAGDPMDLYDRGYCQRGEMENRIKEQLGLFAGRTSCQAWYANQFRVLLSACAYVLVQALRRTALTGTPLAQAQVCTIRLKLLKVAARVSVSVRRVVLHLASSCPMQALFRLAHDRLRTITVSATGAVPTTG
jgi:hypothetical protein